MSIGPFDHPWLSGLFGDDEMRALWSGEQTLRHMKAFEAAWSRALGSVGLFDAARAEDSARAIETAEIDVGDLRAGMARDGVPIPRLIAQFSTAAGGEAVHRGATSQDVMDTATALTLRATSDLIEARLTALIAALSGLEARFGDRALTGRTRMQAATEITVRDRLLTWRLPLETHLTRLGQLRPRVEVVQIGGASGDRKALGEAAQEIVNQVARELGLGPCEKAWHAMRDGICEYAGFLALVTGSLGKMGQDVALMAQQGAAEISLIGGGGSSAMPHKQNPILAELLVTLARFNAVQLSGMNHAMIHEQERSGAAWSLEWMLLPQMAQATGRALAAGCDLCEKVESIGEGPTR